jgi:hypothetical protein
MARAPGRPCVERRDRPGMGARACSRPWGGVGQANGAGGRLAFAVPNASSFGLSLATELLVRGRRAVSRAASQRRQLALAAAGSTVQTWPRWRAGRLPQLPHLPRRAGRRGSHHVTQFDQTLTISEALQPPSRHADARCPACLNWRYVRIPLRGYATSPAHAGSALAAMSSCASRSCSACAAAVVDFVTEA